MPPPPAPPQPLRKLASVTTLRRIVEYTSPNLRGAIFLKRACNMRMKRSSISGAPIRTRFSGGVLRGAARGTIIDGAVVLTVAVKGAAAPFGVAEFDDNEHVASDGAPVQLSATVPLNPLIGVTCKLYVAGFPAFTVAVVEPPLAASIE